MAQDHETDFKDLENMEPLEVHFKYRGKAYTLREADAAAVCSYRNKLMSGTKLGPDGKPVAIENMADAEPHLVSLCLFYQETDKRVDLKDVRALPNRVQRRLYDWIKEVSEIDVPDSIEALEQRIAGDQFKLDNLRKGKDPAKNGQSATASSSV